MSIDRLAHDSAALLVVDMQNAFCHSEGTLGVSGVDIEPARGIIAPIRELVEGFRRSGRPVVWTQQEHFAIDHSRARKRLPSHTAKRRAVSALSGTWDMRIVDELEPFLDDPALLIRKHRFGSFYETRLDLVLRMLGAEALFVAGVTANACIETTLREAYLRDYDVVAVTDCIAAVRPDWEPAAHEVWAQYLGILVESANVLRWLEGGQRPAALALGHLLLEVEDLSASEAFYVGFLGMTVRHRDPFRDGRPLLVTHEGLGLVEGRPPGQGPLEHVAFRARRVRQLAADAQAAGVEVIGGPEPSAYGVSVYLRDPDGNSVELYSPEDEEDR